MVRDMYACAECKKDCTKYTEQLKCSICTSHFHIDCIGVTVAQFEVIRRRSEGIEGWYCGLCRGGPADFSYDQSLLDTSVRTVPPPLSTSRDGIMSEPSSGQPICVALDERFCSLLSSTLESQLAPLKAEIAALRAQNEELCRDLAAVRKLLASERSGGRSEDANAGAGSNYAEVVKRKEASHAVVIRPKKADQSVVQTKSDILKSFNPLTENVQVSKVRPIKNGGVIIECQESSELEKAVTEKLSAGYEIRHVKTPLPNVRVVGISECIDRDLIIPYVIKQNEMLLTPESTCRLLSFSQTKRNSKVFQATLELDVTTYERVLKANHIIVGFDVCAVYDAVTPIRCFKCSGFNHTSRFCKGTLSCPRCGESHEVKECRAGDGGLKCVNCLDLNKKGGTSYPTNHAVWDLLNCAALKLATGRLKHNLFNIPQ